MVLSQSSQAHPWLRPAAGFAQLPISTVEFNLVPDFRSSADPKDSKRRHGAHSARRAHAIISQYEYLAVYVYNIYCTYSVYSVYI